MSIKKVTLARALKERKRLAGQIASAVDLVSQENVKVAGVPRPFDVRAMMAGVEASVERMIALRAVICQANAKLAPKLVELDEVKSMISRLQSISTDADPYYNEEQKRDIQREAVLGKKDVLDKIEAFQKRADALQDAIDEYNAKTQVEIDL
jgi:hypothetical protein